MTTNFGKHTYITEQHPEIHKSQNYQKAEQFQRLKEQ